MSEINLPDPNPGRCLNHRRAGTEMVRCLDYEAVPHICTFPEPVRVPRDGDWAGGNYIYRTPPPTPWVKPTARWTPPGEDARRDA